MGFDLSGLNPKIDVPKGKILKKYELMEWKDKRKAFDKKEGLEDKYWDEYNKFQDDNRGVYFRNNCWWWRPLWNFICENCEGIFSDDQIESGNYNDGKEFTEAQAITIAARIEELDKSGVLDEYEVKYEAARLEAKQNNKGKQLKDEDYNWAESYPYSAENVRDFGKFCKQSGGFAIW